MLGPTDNSVLYMLVLLRELLPAMPRAQTKVVGGGGFIIGVLIVFTSIMMMPYPSFFGARSAPASQQLKHLFFQTVCETILKLLTLGSNVMVSTGKLPYIIKSHVRCGLIGDVKRFLNSVICFVH